MYDFKTNEDFDIWLLEVSASAKKLLDHLPETLKPELIRNDRDSLQVISEWILNNIPSIIELKKKPDLWNELSCYIGEIFRKNLDCNWSIELLDEDDIFFEKPIIECNPPLCPMFLITTLISRNDNLFLVDALEKRFSNNEIRT